MLCPLVYELVKGPSDIPTKSGRESNNSKKVTKDHGAHKEMGHVCFPRAMTKRFHQGKSQLQS